MPARRHIVIGDIHGCYVELQALLARVGFGPEDQVVAVGDLVGRGPKSERVLTFFRDTPNAVSIMGNHEYVHVNFGRPGIKIKPAHEVVRRELGGRYAQWQAFMATMPLYLELADAIVVHGAIEPGVSLDRQREDVMLGLKSGEQHVKSKYAEPWYNVYTGPKPAIVGHHDYGHDHKPLIRPDRVYAIDTGTARGGPLTAVILPGFELVSVPSREDYWARTKRAWEEEHE